MRNTLATQMHNYVNTMLRAALMALALALALALSAAPASADAMDDAVAAFQRGDYVKALRLFHILAERGDAVAQGSLGLMYANGEGVPQDYAEAVKWYRKAAGQGNAVAQFELGVMYATGQGVPQDYVLAHMWFNLAAAQGWIGFEKAKTNRDIAAERMTREQIAEAQRLAREWKPK